jgi:UDP-N-acetylglucosamine--N-acetylmuramyl-(pentapeptide) pyrophosphoryl-undecaprenol N-acetylglucosamine transferase
VIREEKPDIVFCFGGYIALPIAVAAFLNRIKIYTHEQTVSPGLANRIIAWLADKVFCAFDEASRNLPKGKTIVCGNLVRSAIFSVQKKPFTLIKDRPIIYVTGGSLGSHSINTLIKEILPQLLAKYIVVHQTGETKEYEDYEKLMSWQRKLSDEQRNRYFLVKHFFEEEIGYIYSLADLVIGRAGANTFFELLALEKPAIFIPLPWSAHHEQQKQADIFQKFSVGAVFSQSDSSDNLLRLIEKMMNDLPSYKNNFKSLKFLYRQDVASVVLSTLEKI